ncbi:MAG: hypothetical protein Q4P17_10500 [Methanobacterium sp.]|nr:hypothetical protein [Methanobacterium sp.]
MAKRSSTVHLEESTWNEIEEYRKKFGCNRNEAIERMFVERRIILNINNRNINDNIPIIEKIKSEEKKDDDISKAMDSVYNEMPD